MKYFQCSKCKNLVEIDNTKIETRNVEQTDGGNINIEAIKSANISEIICECGDGAKKRVREFKQRGTNTAKMQYDHEVTQRAWIDGGKIKGEEPSGTNLMNNLKLS